MKINKRSQHFASPLRIAVFLLIFWCIAFLGIYYQTSSHKTLLRRKFMPGYWLLALDGKIDYDSDLNLLRHGDRNRHEVAITIDDGPHPENSIPLLDELKAANVRATFFLVGAEAKKRPEILRRMIAEGHEIGNHTNDHFRLPVLNDGEIVKTIRNDEINVRRAVPQYRMKSFRPPGGEFTHHTALMTKNLGYATVLWSDTSGDYESQDPNQIVSQVMDGLENGAIILLHDAYPGTVKALPEILRKIKAEGYQMVTISEMVSHFQEKRAASAPRN
jgi:peptidoglycan/xylan/chitin deacetylase (PgdA/CDA1 family)